jgi:MerR family transcriptional regulator, redox-sensitive transcriptional activator SoxR
MRIGELARRTNIRASAIRYYESLGLLAPPARVAGRREYGDEALDALALILAAQHTGFTLSEISALISAASEGSASSDSWRETAQAKLDEIDGTIARLQMARRTLANAIDCACAGKASACKLVAGASFGSPPAARARRRHR